MDRRPHPNDGEDLCWILVAARDRMSEGFTRLEPMMVGDYVWLLERKGWWYV